ncbi:MAG: ACT domain-containing protein, partial [Fusobacteriaceae bacterium]
SIISYEEMMEMAHLGAGIMETRAVELGKKFNVPIFVGRSLSETGGTNIVEREKILEEKLVTGISVTREIIMTSISRVQYSAQTTAKIFTLLNLQGVNVNMIVQNINPDGELELSFSSTASEKYLLDSAIEEMKNIFPGINAKHLDNLGMISVVGIGMVNNSGIAGRLFSALSRMNIDFYQISTSEISISCSLKRELIDLAVASAAKEFNL